MTTQELELRKERLCSLIQRMNEENITRLEKYVKRLKKETVMEKQTSYALTDEELNSVVSEPQIEYYSGKYTKKEMPYPWAPTKEELIASVQQAQEDVLYGRCISDEQLIEEMKTW